MFLALICELVVWHLKYILPLFLRFRYLILQLVWRGIFIIQYYNWCGVVFSLFNITTGVWRGIFIIQYYNWCGVVFSLLNITTGVAWYCHYFHFIIIEII